MIAWINFAILILSSLLFTLYYVRSASPATREQVMGEAAYAGCARDRVIASIFEMVAMINYIVYIFYPLPVPLPEHFPWPWWVSIIIAAIIGIPAGALMLAGVRAAGEETMKPKKEHTLYGGIYNKIRHPQALGECPLWWTIAFGLHSPFLVIFSFIYIPLFILISYAEEQDLIWRYGEPYIEYIKTTGAIIPKKG